MINLHCTLVLLEFAVTFGNFEVNLDWCVCVVRKTNSIRGYKSYELLFIFIVMHMTGILSLCLFY